MIFMEGLNIDSNQVSDLSPLENMPHLNFLWASENQIIDLSPLQNMTRIEQLHLQDNLIADITPLVANSALATSDTLNLTNNPLSSQAVLTDIPVLEARGVTVTHNSNPAALPEIDLLNGAVPVVDGVSVIDLGTVAFNAASPTLTIEVQNNGAAGSSLITSNLSVASPFSITEGLNPGLLTGGSDTFTLECSTALAGSFSETVSLDNNDADEDPFTFTVTATITGISGTTGLGNWEQYK